MALHAYMVDTDPYSYYVVSLARSRSCPGCCPSYPHLLLSVPHLITSSYKDSHIHCGYAGCALSRAGPRVVRFRMCPKVWAHVLPDSECCSLRQLFRWPRRWAGGITRGQQISVLALGRSEKLSVQTPGGS